MGKQEQEQAADNMARLRDRVAAFVDRDFVYLGNTIQCGFRSHAEATAVINEMRRMAGVAVRADMVKPVAVGGTPK
jgi:uncharacterized protein YchJ